MLHIKENRNNTRPNPMPAPQAPRIAHWSEIFSKPIIDEYFKKSVKVYFNADTIDSYIVLYFVPDELHTVHVFSMSENPNHPCGVNTLLYSMINPTIKELNKFGKELSYTEIPEKVVHAIINRINTIYYETI